MLSDLWNNSIYPNKQIFVYWKKTIYNYLRILNLLYQKRKYYLSCVNKRTELIKLCCGRGETGTWLVLIARRPTKVQGLIALAKKKHFFSKTVQKGHIFLCGIVSKTQCCLLGESIYGKNMVKHEQIVAKVFQRLLSALDLLNSIVKIEENWIYRNIFEHFADRHFADRIFRRQSFRRKFVTDISPTEISPTHISEY